MQRLLPLLLLVPAVAPRPAGAERIGLRDAIRTALARNVQLASAAIDVGVADAYVAGTHGPFDLRLTADAAVDQSVTAFGGDVTTTSHWGAGLARRIETGGDLALRFETRREPVIENGAVETRYLPRMALTLTQPLLRGFGRAVAEAGIRRAGHARSAAGWRRTARAAEVLRQVVHAYWNLGFAAREVEIQREALDLARAQLDLSRAEIAAGRLAPSDALAVESALATRRGDLARAEGALVERTLDLRRVLGLPIAPGMEPLVPADTPRVDPAPPDAAPAAARALRDNPSLRAARADGAVREVDVLVATRGRLPVLNTTLSGGLSGVQADYRAALDPGEAAPNWSASLQLVWLLGDRSARAAEEVARLEKRRSALGVGDLEQALVDQAVRLSAALRTAAQQVESTRTAAGLAARELAAERERFAAGKVRNQDVLIAQDALRSAHLEEARAAVGYLNALASLQAVTGEILERYGVAPR